MKDKVFLGLNGELAIGIPLFMIEHEESLGNMDGYRVQLTDSKPKAWILDLGNENLPLVNAEIVDSKLECLGDL